MKAVWNGQAIAQSDDTVVVEGNHYFPRESLREEYIRDSQHTTCCGWKGTASYYDLEVDGQINANAVWYYADPFQEAGMVRGRVAFWGGVRVEE